MIFFTQMILTITTQKTLVTFRYLHLILYTALFAFYYNITLHHFTLHSVFTHAGHVESVKL